MYYAKQRFPFFEKRCLFILSFKRVKNEFVFALRGIFEKIPL